MSNRHEEKINEARRAAKAVFLAAEAEVADDLSRILTGLADALAEEATREAARLRDLQHPELTPESVTDAGFESQSEWWQPGDAPIQSVVVPKLIEEVADAAYQATLKAHRV